MEYIGYAAGTMTVLSFVPQVIRTYRTRHVDDLSARMVVLLVLAGSLWVTYGFLRGDVPVIATNLGTLSLTTALMVAKVRFGRARKERRSGGRTADADPAPER